MTYNQLLAAMEETNRRLTRLESLKRRRERPYLTQEERDRLEAHIQAAVKSLEEEIDLDKITPRTT